MANIRVDTTYTVIDGSEVVFTAPCNCSEIDGLKIYYPDGSKEFTFKDAHGNALTGIGEAFAKGALVKVILDVTNGFAYIQNADTNSYLESTKASVPKVANGSVVSVSDSGDAPLLGLKLYGKTAQNGTPTPETPVPLESVGASGEINIAVGSSNLAKLSITQTDKNAGVTITPTKDGNLILNGTTTGSMWKVIGNFKTIKGKKYTVCGAKGVRLSVWCNKQSKIVCIKEPHVTYCQFTAADSYSHSVCVSHDAGSTFDNLQVDCTVNIGSTALPWEPYKNQTLTASTPNGLPGIPVSSGGNYTDESGQQWICDEIDFARGVYVRRIEQYTFTGNEVMQVYGSVNANGYGRMQILCDGADSIYSGAGEKVPSFCDKYTPMGATELSYHVNPGGTGYYFAFLTGRQMAFSTQSTTIEAFKKEITGTTILYQFATPIETALSAEELAAYAALHSNKQNTTVFNDGGADMEIRYCTPNTAVPMNLGSGRAGNLLTVDEHGHVVTAPKSGMPFAPAGYGYGGQMYYSGTDDEAALEAEFDSILATMEDRSAKQISLNSVTFNSYMGLCVISKASDAHAVVSHYCQAPRGIAVSYKVKFNGAWSPVEHENPPMVLGVEYRTTERYNGKPVYVKLVDCGALPNASSKYINTGISMDYKIIEYKSAITSEDGYEFEMNNLNSSLLSSMAVNPMHASWYIYFTTEVDQSSYKVMACIKYTKD